VKIARIMQRRRALLPLLDVLVSRDRLLLSAEIDRRCLSRRICLIDLVLLGNLAPGSFHAPAADKQRELRRATPRDVAPIGRSTDR